MNEGISKTNFLLGALGKFYSSMYLFENSFAYISLEVISKTRENYKVLEFSYGPNRILIDIPNEVLAEVKQLSRDNMKNNIPHYIFDYLSCKIEPDRIRRHINDMSIDSFVWVKVKDNFNSPSNNQQIAIKDSILPVMLVDVNGVWSNRPKNIKIASQYLHKYDLNNAVTSN